MAKHRAKNRDLVQGGDTTTKDIFLNFVLTF